LNSGHKIQIVEAG